MHTLEPNDWVIFNNITCQIHRINDFEEMCRAVLEQLRLLVRYDAAVFYYSDEDHIPRLTKAVCCDYSNAAATDYLQSCQSADYNRGLILGGKRMIYRESDIFSDAERSETVCYRRFLHRQGYHHCVHILPAERDRVLANIVLFRGRNEPDFSRDDLFYLDMLEQHLALRLQHSYAQWKIRNEKLSVEECEMQFHLTARETTILGLLMQGLPNDDICSMLTITNNTLKKHILNLYKKLKIRNRTQLFKMVREHS